MRYANELIIQELQDDREFLKEYIEETIRGFFTKGEIGVSCSMLRNIVNATIGFKELASKLDKTDKGLMQMLTVDANPQSANLFQIIQAVLNHENLTFGDVDIKDKDVA